MQYLNKADEVSAHLLALINDILDMSRIEAGKVELEHKVFSLRGLGDRLYDMFAKQLQARGIRYEVNLEDMTVDSVVGDELRISQIIINFLSNAVKFTSEGEIIVTFRQMMLQDNVADFMFRVHDTGIGMDHAFLNRIFRPFEQESIETGRKFGGTGLGMTITDQLVRLMGGEIVVDTEPGRGSTFSAYIPLRLATPEQVEDLKLKEQTLETAPDSIGSTFTYQFDGKRFLLAEDNEINAMIVVELLARRGAAVDRAENGQAVVDRFRSMPVGTYDAILMDIQMPVLNGWGAAEQIRDLEREDAAAIPIIALSANDYTEDVERSRKAGMNGHVGKPIDLNVLKAQLAAATAEAAYRGNE